VRAHTVFFATQPAEKNTAEKLAVMREVKTSKIACEWDHPACPLTVRQFASRVSPISPANHRRSGEAMSRDAATPPQED